PGGHARKRNLSRHLGPQPGRGRRSRLPDGVRHDSARVRRRRCSPESRAPDRPGMTSLVDCMRGLSFVGLVALAFASASLASSPLPVFEGCLASSQLRPSAIVVACGDGNFYVTGLKWTRWTKMAATATGLAHQNDCKPYCAAGHFHTYPLALTLSRPEVCSNARTEFTRFTYRFTKAKPRSEAHYRTTLAAPFRVTIHCP